MLAHNKVQGGNSQDHYQLPPPQQQPQRHDHRQFVHQHQLPEHEHDRFRPLLAPQTQAPQKRMYHHHQEDEHEQHYSVGQDSLHRQHLQHHARLHRQVDLSRPRSRNMSTATMVSSTIHPTIANMVSPMSPHRSRSHPYSLAPPSNSTMAMKITTAPRASSAYRSFSPVSSSSSSLSSSSSSSSRNVSLSPGLESEATMHHPSRSCLVPSSPSHPHQHHHLPCHHRHPSSISNTTASRGHSVPRRADEMAEIMKREYVMEEFSSDSMMDQCEPQREWSTSSSQHTNSPSPVMCSSSYPVPNQESSPPQQQHRSLQKHYRYRKDDEEDQQVEVEDEKERDCQLKRPFGDQYTHTSLSHQQHPRSSQRLWQPRCWEQQEQQKHHDRKREHDYCLEREQQQQREEHIIQPPSPTSSNRNHISRRGSESTDSTTTTVTTAVFPSSSPNTLSSSTVFLLPSSSSSSSSSASLTRQMVDLYPARKQQRSSRSFYPVPNSPNNAATSPPQHSSLLPSSTYSSTTSLSSSLPPLCPVATTAVNSAHKDTTHAPSPSIPFELSLSSREKPTSSSSGRSLPPPPLPSITTVAPSTSPPSSTLQYQQTQPPPSPTTKRPIDVSEPKSYEYRSKAQRMLYERHPPSPINNNNNNCKNSRSASTSPSSSPLPHTSDIRERSTPLSPPPPPHPVHVTTLANRASFGSLRDYQSDKRQKSHIYQPQHQSHHLQRYSVQQQQQPHRRHQYPQQMSLPPTSSLSQYEQEKQLPLIGRPQQQHQSNQQQPQPYRHSYPQPGHRSSSAGLGLDLPKFSSLAFSQRQTLEPESHSGSSGRCSNGGSSGSSSSSNSVVFSFMPRPPTPSSMSGHGKSQIMPSSSTHHHQQQQQQHQPLPGTEGMTVVRNDEGAIMVYNPITDAMTFRCELCPGESFGRIHDLKRHQTSKHQEMTWPCDFCHRPFVRRDALLRHYTVKAARDDGLHPATHEVDRLLAARARAKMLY